MQGVSSVDDSQQLTACTSCEAENAGEDSGAGELGAPPRGFRYVRLRTVCSYAVRTIVLVSREVALQIIRHSLAAYGVVFESAWDDG